MMHPVKATFLGAAGEVSGSCQMLRFMDKGIERTILIDCGLSQSGGYINRLKANKLKLPSNFDPKEIAAVIITHSHIDHVGLVPYLWKIGYRGPIYATFETILISQIMLHDAGHIQETDTNKFNSKRARTRKSKIEPLYTEEDAKNSIKLFQEVKYNETVDLKNGAKFRFQDAAHILGSASIEIWIRQENGRNLKIVVSGDIGHNVNSQFYSADYLILESTYGNRIQEKINMKKVFLKIANIIIDTYMKGGKVIVPAFVSGRIQYFIFGLNEAMRFLSPNKAEILSKVPIIIDTPTGRKATKIFQQIWDNNRNSIKHMLGRSFNYYDKNNINPFFLPNLRIIESSKESQALNEDSNSMVIISASGMCNAGRILHHLKHNLWKDTTVVLFVGYQALGTIGREILDGYETVCILGEKVCVQAQIISLSEFSAHADQEGLLNFPFRRFRKPPKRIILVHGEEDALEELAEKFQQHDIEIIVPKKKQTIAIYKDKYEILESFKAHEPISSFKSQINTIQNGLRNLGVWFNDPKNSEGNYIEEDLELIDHNILETSEGFRNVKHKFKLWKSNIKKGS